jgi:class 3 adenylate cyclase
VADADRDAVFETLRDLGLPEEAVRRAVERGRPEDAIFDAVLLPEIAERTLSANDVVARGGPSLAEIEGFWEAFGLPIDDADEPRFSEEEADIFQKLNAMQDVWPVEVGLQVARVYGRLLARIAQAEIQVFREYVQPRLRSDDDPVAAMLATRDAFAQLLPTTGPLLLGVHRRWVEHHIAQELVGVAEGETTAGLPGTVRISLLFCDLKDFTAFAQERGDGAAVAAIDRFAQVVSHERGPEVRFTKALGDGYMLVYASATTALDVGQRVIAAMRTSPVETPTVHASAHTGTAIAREGDYFGGAVNLAARLLDAAAGDELVATAATVEAGGEAFEWDPAGSVGVRGVSEPVEVFRLRC